MTREQQPPALAAGTALWNDLCPVLARTVAERCASPEEGVQCIAGVMSGLIGATVATVGKEAAVELLRYMADEVAKQEFTRDELPDKRRPALYVVKP